MKVFKWIVVLALLGGGGYIAWKFYSAKGIAGEALSLIPDDAVYAIITDDPIGAWKKISGTQTWSHLQTNAYFASLTSSANSLDSLIRDNSMLFDLIGSKSVVMSAHMTGTKDYDFLFFVDLAGVSGVKLKFLTEYIPGFTASGYTVKKEKYFDNDIIILHDPSDNTNLYISVPGTFVVLSYTKKVLINALDAQLNGATIPADKLISVGGNSFGKLYLNYYRLPDLVKSYTDGENEYVNNLSASLLTTNLDLDVTDDVLTAKGYTYINDSAQSYIRTLGHSGKGPTEFFEIAPQRTGFALGLGFESFSKFFSEFSENLKKDVKEYQEYKDNMSTIQNFLKIDLQKQLIDWIGEEVAFLQMQSSGEGTDMEVAVVLKANNIEKAKKDLAYIEDQVRKRTPVKFKSVEHRGYAINYLGMKGVFKVLLGKFFARYDKPYYTIINNFVIFSNHPQTLESMIDDFLDRKTLDRSDDFKEFRRRFEDESAVFAYVSTPVLFNTLTKLADAETRKSMTENEEYITCFRHIGFQMVPDKGRFVTHMIEQFKPELDVVIEEAEFDTDADPMKLPYIYAPDVNAKSFTGYYEDSTVHFRVELKNGFKDGSFTEYYENGREKMTGKFRRDKRDGHWRMYNEDGDLVMRRTYENGEVKRERN